IRQIQSSIPDLQTFKFKSHNYKVKFYCYGLWSIDYGLFSVNKPLINRAVRIDPSVAHKGPVAAVIVGFFEVKLLDDHFFVVMRGLVHDGAKRVGYKRPAPELQPRF